MAATVVRVLGRMLRLLMNERRYERNDELRTRSATVRVGGGEHEANERDAILRYCGIE